MIIGLHIKYNLQAVKTLTRACVVYLNSFEQGSGKNQVLPFGAGSAI